MSKQANEPELYGKAKLLHITASIIAVPELTNSSKEGQLGLWDGVQQVALYDPDGPDPVVTIVHEICGHGMRYAIGIGDPATEAEEERAVGLIEMGVCAFVRDNPALSMKILRDLIGEKKWRQVLKSMKPSSV